MKRAVLFFFILILAGSLAAQEPAPVTPAQEPLPPRATAPAKRLEPRPVAITVGRGELLQFKEVVDRVSMSEPAIADAVVVSPYEVVINAKAPGVTTAMIWHGTDVSRYDITVQPDLTEVRQQLASSLPNEHIQVTASKDSILLTGVVSDAEIAKRAVAIAAMHAKSVVNLIQSPPPDNRQVMLQVKFATVDRTALSQFGVNLFSVDPKLLGTATTQQFNFPRIGNLQFTQGAQGPQTVTPQVSISDLLNLFAFRPDLNFGATLRALQEKDLLQILAEPNLITVSGHEASFLAGGEFPFPVITSTGTGGNAAPVVTVQFRKFGVQLDFTPTVDTSGLIHLKVAPEVSSLDFSNALTIQGFLIPAISSRRAETEVDLHEGESFAIAGLIDNRVTSIVSKIPWIGDVPIVGKLFQTKSMNKTNTELLVVITPRFVKPFAAGEQVPGIGFPSPFIDGSKPGDTKKPRPQFSGPRGTQPGGPPK